MPSSTLKGFEYAFEYGQPGIGRERTSTNRAQTLHALQFYPDETGTGVCGLLQAGNRPMGGLQVPPPFEYAEPRYEYLYDLVWGSFYDYSKQGASIRRETHQSGTPRH